MKEIKFRAWDPVEKKMYTSQNEDHPYEVYESVSDISRVNDTLNNGYIWIQYTGFKDSKEKEIYEGDIVKDKKNHSYYVLFYDIGGYWAIQKTENKIADYSMLGDFSSDDFILKDFEVIGNIYEREAHNEDV